MGLGIWFSEDIARILRGVGEGVAQLVAQRGLHDAADVAYVAGYNAALRTVATSLGVTLPVTGGGPVETFDLVEWVLEGQRDGT